MQFRIFYMKIENKNLLKFYQSVQNALKIKNYLKIQLRKKPKKLKIQII